MSGWGVTFWILSLIAVGYLCWRMGQKDRAIELLGKLVKRFQSGE